MSLWKIAWRSIQQRSLASALTAVSMALGVALVVAVLVIHGVIDKSFRRSAQGYNLIVGPKGSSLDLVLNTVYHLGRPLGTMPHGVYDQLASNRFAAYIETAVPVCIGDNVQGHRLIGTNPDLFDKLEYQDGRRYAFAQGRNFDWDPKLERPEAVVGAIAARKTGLGLGDTFRPTHGDSDVGEEHGEFSIVGVLAPTGTPIDRAFYIHYEAFYTLHTKESADDKPLRDPTHDDDPLEPAGHHGSGHGSHGESGPPGAKGSPGDAFALPGLDEPKKPPAAKAKPSEGPAKAAADDHAHDDAHDHEQAHDDERRLSAVLVLSREMLYEKQYELPRRLTAELNQPGSPGVQVVAPTEEITRLFEGMVGDVQMVLLILAVLIVVVAGIGILVSIYNSMNDRRREIAIMRALGARRSTVMLVILFESILLALGGGAIGLLLGHGLTAILGPIITDRTNVIVSALQFQPNELILIPGLIVLASLVGYLPAVIAYRTDVAQSLISSP